MATPTYLGAGQPQLGNGLGLLSRIGSYLSGSGTPAYRGAGQPAPAITGGVLQQATPSYAAAPVREQVVQAPTEAESAAVEQQTSACPIDAEALASGHIAIVIPRGT